MCNDIRSESPDCCLWASSIIPPAALRRLFEKVQVFCMSPILRGALRRRFALEPDEAAALVAAAQGADAEAVDLYRFTSVLKQRLDIDDRERIIAMMWKLSFADGKVHELEDNVIWRVAELLGVSTQARIRLKQAARDAAGE